MTWWLPVGLVAAVLYLLFGGRVWVWVRRWISRIDARVTTQPEQGVRQGLLPGPDLTVAVARWREDIQL